MKRITKDEVIAILENEKIANEEKLESIREWLSEFSCETYAHKLFNLSWNRQEFHEEVNDEDIIDAALDFAKNSFKANNGRSIISQVMWVWKGESCPQEGYPTLEELESTMTPAPAEGLEEEGYIWVMCGTSLHRAQAFADHRGGCVLPEIIGTYNGVSTGLQVNLLRDWTEHKGRANNDRLYYYGRTQANKALSKPAVLCCLVKASDIYHEPNGQEYFIPRNAEIKEFQIFEFWRWGEAKVEKLLKEA